MAERQPSLRFREIRRPDDPAIAAAYRLLRRVFSARELIRRRDLREAIVERNRGVLGDLNWHMIVAERAGVLIGVATVSYLGDLNVGMVGYLAVRAGERAGGVGLKLRAKLLHAVHRDALRIRGRPVDALVGEVKPGNPWLTHLVTDHAAIALDFPYWQPSIDGLARPVPLVLYYQPIGRERISLEADLVRRLLYAIWRRLYRVAKPMKDRRFRAMLSALQGRRTIGSRLRATPVKGASGRARRTRPPTSSRRRSSSPRTAARSRRR